MRQEQHRHSASCGAQAVLLTDLSQFFFLTEQKLRMPFQEPSENESEEEEEDDYDEKVGGSDTFCSVQKDDMNAEIMQHI